MIQIITEKQKYVRIIKGKSINPKGQTLPIWWWIANQQEPVTPLEIIECTGIASGTVRRIVRELYENDLLSQIGDSNSDPYEVASHNIKNMQKQSFKKPRKRF